MLPEQILQTLKPKVGQYTLQRKESFIDKQRRLSEMERQQILQKKQREMQLFRQTFNATGSSKASSKPRTRILIKTKGGCQPIPLDEYHKCVTTPNAIRRHQQSVSQSLPRIETEQIIPDTPQEQPKELSIEQSPQIEYSPQPETEEDHPECVIELPQSDYEQFLLHLTGKCICAICPQNKCKCKFDYQPQRPKISWQSHYNREFKPMEIKDQDLKMNVDSVGRYQVADLCNFQTTMATDYRSFDMRPIETRERPVYRPSIGSTPMTTYKKFFMDYGDLHYEQFKQGHYKTVIPELKFTSSTSYGSEFRKLQQEETPNQKPADGKPFPTVGLFLGQSTNKSTYDLKTQDKRYLVRSSPEVAMRTPSYDKQYISVTKKDF